MKRGLRGTSVMAAMGPGFTATFLEVASPARAPRVLHG
jgi:hypothetical protein